MFQNIITLITEKEFESSFFVDFLFCRIFNRDNNEGCFNIGIEKLDEFYNHFIVSIQQI